MPSKCTIKQVAACSETLQPQRNICAASISFLETLIIFLKDTLVRNLTVQASLYLSDFEDKRTYCADIKFQRQILTYSSYLLE